MKIWTIVVGEPSPVDGSDTRLLRTGLLTRCLRARGHDVTWFNGTFDHATKTERFNQTTIQTDADGTTLIFLHGRPYAGHVSLPRIANHIDGARAFAEIAPKLPAPDVIACSYPTIELAAAVAEYARARDIPFILDLRDLWPDMIAEVAPKPLRWLARLLMAPWYKSARKSMRAASGLVGFAGPYLDWGLKKTGRAHGPNDRVFHLAADPQPVDAESLNASAAYWDARGIAADTVNLAFAGMISPRHDFTTLIDAFRRLPPEKRARLRMVFCGRGEVEDALKFRAADMPEILFAGWRNRAEIAALLARAAAGLLPYRNTPDFLMSFPNKIGEYTGAGLPVITPLGGEVGRLIETENCGIVYREGDVESCAQILAALADGTVDLAALRAGARAAYSRHFDAEKIYAAYAGFLESQGTKTAA
ncbi:MAG: glycosyltransferase [Alphaproteobacteria bacterium]|nr:glycosyltransferase [Alphaproteobacteria bacterium]USO07434.1 MAG: glycosyltransferase [Rhodospirillales bacterium]